MQCTGLVPLGGLLGDGQRLIERAPAFGDAIHQSLALDQLQNESDALVADRAVTSRWPRRCRD